MPIHLFNTDSARKLFAGVSREKLLPGKKVRHEFKYILTPHQARLIEEYIDRRHLSTDEYAKDGEYAITSLYFDTPCLRDYYEKLAGIERRQKLRARVYGSDFLDQNQNHVWLEQKCKKNMTTFKYRTHISAADWNAFCGPNKVSFDICSIYGAHKDKEGFRRFAFPFARDCYKPHVVVRYKRRAFEGEFFANFRLTLDSKIETGRWNDFARGTELLPVARGKVVMEVKFTEAMPWWFRHLLEKFNLSRKVFSKYVNAVDTIHRAKPLPR